MSYANLFDIEPGLALLDQCTIGPLPRKSAEAVINAIQGHMRAGVRGMPGLPVRTEAVEHARVATARLINAGIDEVAFIKNTVEGLNVIANGIDWRDGDEIVASRLEFPANVYTWMKLRDRGVTLRIAEPDGQRVTPESLFAEVTEKTRAITVSSVQYLNGYAADLGEIGAFCRARGIYFIVDAIQSLGALPMDVHACNIDFLAAGGHKWLCSPIGTGVLYVRRDIAPDMWITNLGHLSVKESRPFTRINFDLKEDVTRFEGGVVSFPLVCGFGQSVQTFLDAGPDTIRTRILELGDQAVAGLTTQGFDVISPRGAGEGSGIISFDVGSGDRADAILAYMTDRRVQISRHSSTMRVAPHFFNTAEEIDLFLRTLKDAP